jgi:phosphate transport system protein
MLLRELFNIFRKDSLYNRALEQAHAMLDRDWTMYQASVKSLRHSDRGEIDIDIYAMDKETNADERAVRRKIMTHLAISGASADLQAGLALVSVVIDMERIGDYTKNIYDLARQHPLRLHGGSLEPQLSEAESAVTRLFSEMIPTFKNSDVERARSIMTAYKQELSGACEGITMAVVSGRVTDLNTADGAAVSLYARYLKRIAAHSRNIISSVVNPFERIGYKEKKES